MSSRASLSGGLIPPGSATLRSSGEKVTISPSAPAIQQSLGARTLSPFPSGGSTSPVAQPFQSSVSATQQPASQPAMTTMMSSAPRTVQYSSSPDVGKTKGDTWGFTFSPLFIISLVLIFIVVFIILFVTKTNMVTDLVNGERVINNSKLVFWTVLISIIISIVAIIIRSLAR